MQIEIVAHLGGSPATSACSDVLSCDAFTGNKDSVTCRECVNAIARNMRNAVRFLVDYNAEGRTWGVYDRRQSRFITSATTRASARIQRRRIAQQYS